MVALLVTVVILVPHLHLFKVILILNLLANLVSLLAPLTTKRLKQPIPIYVMAGCSLIGILSPCFMNYDNSLEYERRPSE